MKYKNLLLLIVIMIFMSSCDSNAEMTDTSLYDDLSNAGFLLEEFNLETLSNDFSYVSVRTITDPLSDDYGIIYELSEDDVNLFYESKLTFSISTSDIVFIYKIDNYVLEMYHSTTSTFPGFLRQYDFESNYQFSIFYLGSLQYSPVIQDMLDDGGDKFYTVSDEEMLLYHAAYNRRNLQMKSVEQISYNNVTYTVIMYYSVEDALEAFPYQDTLNAGTPNWAKHYILYQNYVIIIDVNYTYENQIYDPFLEVEYLTYSHDQAQYEPWEID